MKLAMLTTISHRAMATDFTVILAPSDDHLVEPAFEALELLDHIEANLTIYRPESEISRINAAAGHQAVALSTPTFQLLRRSDQWSRRTAGAFDVTAGPLVRVWGFTQRQGRKPAASEIRDALARVGYQRLWLDDGSCSARLESPDMEINLGAIGKGFALDEISRELLQRGLRNFLIHGGGSSVLACGDQVPESGLGWAVGLAHPSKSNLRLAGIHLRDQSLSTSGSGKQYFHFRGRRYGHVIDPRSGYPAGDLLALTAVADNATDAEACSTGFFVLGSEAIVAAAAADPELPRMIGVRAENRQDSVRVTPFAEFDWVDPPAETEQN